MTEGSTISGLILLIGIGVLFILMLARQIPFQILGRITGPIFRPIGKLFGLKAITRAGPGSVRPAHMGPSAWAALSRAARHAPRPRPKKPLVPISRTRTPISSAMAFCFTGPASRSVISARPAS